MTLRLPFNWTNSLLSRYWNGGVSELKPSSTAGMGGYQRYRI